VKWNGKYGRNPNWIVKRYWKYIRQLWNDIENMEESRIVKGFGIYGRKATWMVKCYEKYRRK
jgi:hypothetical protein